MGFFQFKQFSVRNERSSMKVNTDGVLLGAAMTLRPSDRLLLDIGTGTGVIALMAAQRLAESRAGLKSEADGEAGLSGEAQFSIIGIDIDEASAAESAENFAMSPWASRLASRHVSLNDFEREFDVALRATASPCYAEEECTTFRYKLPDDESRGEGEVGGNETPTGKCDVIFSNPPYFESSLKSPDERKRTARHAETLSYREIIAFAARHLTSVGRLSMILPYETEREVIRYAASFNLRLFRRLRIRTTPSHPFSRVILEFILATPNEVISEELTIQDSTGYTDGYRSLVKNFLLI